MLENNFSIVDRGVEEMSACERYDRQLHDLGIDGQFKIRKSTVLIAGLGGLGSPIAVYLTAMGVGRLIIVDRDVVEATNLNRQILYTPSDLGKVKVEVAKSRLTDMNPEVEVEAHRMSVEDREFEPLVKKSDILIDGLDGWRSRLVLNKLAVKYKKPLLHAAVESWYGQHMVVIPGRTPCLHCLFSNLGDRSCTRIVGPVAGSVGTFVAVQAAKLLSGKGDVGEGFLYVFDFKRNSFDKIRAKRNPNCPVCAGIS